MFASEMVNNATVIGAGDDDPADLTFADGANVAVMSGCAVWLVDVERDCEQEHLAAYAAARGPE